MSDEAMKCFDTALEIDANDLASWINKGIVFQDLKKHEEAIKCYTKALKLDPKNAQAWHNKGISLDKLGKAAEARRCFDRAGVLSDKTGKGGVKPSNSLMRETGKIRTRVEQFSRNG